MISTIHPQAIVWLTTVSGAFSMIDSRQHAKAISGKISALRHDQPGSPVFLASWSTAMSGVQPGERRMRRGARLRPGRAVDRAGIAAALPGSRLETPDVGGLVGEHDQRQPHEM